MQSQWLACSSERTTIHIFAVNFKNFDIEKGITLTDEEAKIADHPEDDNDILKDAESGDPHENKKSKFNFMKSIVPIKLFADEWSYAKFKVPKENNSQH